MKQITILLWATLCLCAFVTNAQTITDTRTIGSWVFSTGNMATLDHFKPTVKFPPATIKGRTSSANWADKTVKLSAAVQNKMQAILQVFKDAYPQPYKESVCYGVNYVPAIAGDKPLAYYLHLGDYRFSYDKGGKIKPINPASQLGNMYDGYANVYVNYIPEQLRLTSLMSSVEVKEKLSYYTKKPLEEGDRKVKPKGKVLMVGPQNNFANEIKGWNLTNPPTAKFNNEADNFFSLRHLTGSINKTENKVYYRVSNLVIVSANNQLPFIPVNRKEFLDLLEENLNEDAEVQKILHQKSPDYGKNKAYYDKMYEDNSKDRKRKYDVINLIRETFKNELELPAIIGPNQVGLTNAGFYHIFNVKKVPTAKEVSDVFIIDKQKGYALYRYDVNFYKGLKEDEVKTIAIEWEDKITVPLDESFPDANAKNKEGLLLTNVNYYAAFRNKFNWSKLASLLTK